MSRHQQNTDKLIAAIRVANEVVLGAMQMAILASTPKPKYKSEVVGETGSEVCTYNPFKDAKIAFVPNGFFDAPNDLPRMSDFEIENINSLLNEPGKVQVTSRLSTVKKVKDDYIPMTDVKTCAICGNPLSGKSSMSRGKFYCTQHIN